MAAVPERVWTGGGGEGHLCMRIEGTYTFLAPVEQVYGALVSPDTLRSILPGCERILQFGPPSEQGVAPFEARLHTASGVTTLTLTPTAARRPESLRLTLHAHTPYGAFSGSGSIDLVAQDECTIGAYAWELRPTGAPIVGPDGRPMLTEERAATVARTIREALARALPQRHNTANLLDLLPGIGLVTEHGEILALPAEPPAPPLPVLARPLAQRAAWMGAGLAAGLVAIALAVSVVRRASAHDAT